MRRFRLFWAGACFTSGLANIIGSITAEDSWQLLFGLLCLIICGYLLHDHFTENNTKE